QQHHMGVLLDIVPNHMAASIENPWWRDLLARGAASPYAAFFDIDPAADALELPILGDSIDNVIGRGEIRVDADRMEAVYHDVRLPLARGSASADVGATLQRQHYRLVPWWIASDRTTYRRFFDITELVALRVEDDDVFAATHALVRQLATDGVITGLRVDHIDGLYDPASYLARLREFVRGPDG